MHLKILTIIILAYIYIISCSSQVNKLLLQECAHITNNGSEETYKMKLHIFNYENNTSKNIFNLFAQVQDSETDEGLPGVFIAIGKSKYNYYDSTVTDIEGNFKFHNNKISQSDTVFFKYVGFYDLSLPINSDYLMVKNDSINGNPN